MELPALLLENGRRYVLQAVLDLVRALLASGHEVYSSSKKAVSVKPVFRINASVPPVSTVCIRV